jgi:positive regulator of sigma E activity
VRRKGRVIGVDGSQATVCFESAEACAKCEARDFCQASGSKRSVQVENSIGAGIDDEVYVEQTPGVGLAAAFLVFGLPVMLALLGMILAARWREAWAILIAVLCFGIGLLIAKFLNDVVARSAQFLPKITEITKRKGP